MNKIGVYGSLRKGEYNYNFFLRDQKYIKTVTKKGFKLYSLGSYPCIVRTNNPDDKVVFDLFEVSDSVKKAIDRMEFQAGYHVDYIEEKNNQYEIYVFRDGYSNTHLIKHGDWVKYRQDEKSNNFAY